MNRPALFALISLNALLAFVLAGEWVAESENSETPSAEIKTVETQDEELPSLDLEAKSEEEYSDLVERPLFIKGRKPVAEPEPEPETAPVAAVKKVEAFVWDLTGIFTSPKGVTAFFSRINGKVEKDNYRKLKLGDEIDGWKLSEITADKVTLSQAGETKMLPLRKAKPKNAPPTPAVPVANQANRQEMRIQPPAQGQQPQQNLPANSVSPETETFVKQVFQEMTKETQSGDESEANQ